MKNRNPRKTGQGRLPGGIGYPGKKRTTTNNIPNYVENVLQEAEARLGVTSQTCLTIYAVRRAKLHKVTLKAILRDIRKAERESAAL